MKAYNKYRVAHADHNPASSKPALSINNTASVKKTILKTVHFITLAVVLSACDGRSKANNNEVDPNINKPGVQTDANKDVSFQDIFNKKYLLFKPMSFEDATKVNFVRNEGTDTQFEMSRFTNYFQLNKKHTDLSEILKDEPYCEVFIERAVNADKSELIYPSSSDLKISGMKNKSDETRLNNNSKYKYFFKLIFSVIENKSLIAANLLNLQCYDITESDELKKHIGDFFSIEVAEDKSK